METDSTDKRHRLIVDQYNRRINYLRISVTDRCNLRCLYCVPSEEIQVVRYADILSYEEILRLVSVAADLGIDKVRVTGGEPLVRKGIYNFISSLTGIAGIKDVSITTNGVLLKAGLESLRAAGIKRINVSLDTLNRRKYEMITGSDEFEAVWLAIEKARKMGFKPIKINVVVMKGINDDELKDFAKLSVKNHYHIRFIEYMPISANNNPQHLRYIPNSAVQSKLEEIEALIPVTRRDMDGPVRRFKLKGALGEIGFISPISNHFCQRCNRLRLTAIGQIRPCLLSDRQIDIKKHLRNDGSDLDLRQIFLKAIYNKPLSHHMSPDELTPFPELMSSIGG